MLQLINEARTNPAAAAVQLTSNLTPDVQATLQYYNVNLPAVEQTIATATPQPPLAWNTALANAAQGQSQYQADNQIQSHTGANGSTSQERITAAGYTNATSSGENAYAYVSTVQEAMQAFMIDWGVPSDGHRINIQQPGVSAQNAYRDVGIGIVQTNPANPSFGPMVVTQDFAAQANAQAQLVGVAYYDTSGTHFYQPGEGQGGVQIDAVNLQTGQVSSTQTWDSGGYELSLAPGQYRIIASLNDQVFQALNVTIGNVNIEQDFTLTDSWQGGTRESAIAAAQPAVTPTVTTPPTPTTPQSPPPVNVTALASSTQPAVTPTVTTTPTTPQSPSQGALAALTSSTPTLAPTSASPAPSPLLSLFSNSWSAWNAGT